MTPCEKLGYKVGDRFRVIIYNKYFQWPVGTIIVLHKDDGTDTPKFHHECDYDERGYMNLSYIKPLTPTLKTGDEITQDGKKYRVTLEEIPQYEFKPGMICRVDWSKADAACFMHSNYTRVVYIKSSENSKEKVAYSTIDGGMNIGYVNTSSLRPE